MGHLFIMLNRIVEKGFDFKIDVNEPTATTGENWFVNYTVTAKANSNLAKIKELILNTINNICMTQQDVEQYSNQNLAVFEVDLDGKLYSFRTSISWIYLKTIFEKKIPLASTRFSVSDGLRTYPFSPNSRTSISIEYNNNSYIDIYGLDRAKIYAFINRIDESNFDEINNSYSHEEELVFLGQQHFKINLNQLNNIDESRKGLEFKYVFKNTYTLEQLSNLTEFKVQTLNK